MRRLAFALLLTLLPGAAWATCANTWQVKDAAGTTQTFCRGTDGTNYISYFTLLDPAGTNAAGVTAGGALKVDASATTQPISGTITANAGGGTFTVGGAVSATQSGSWNVGQSGSWTVTANAGSGTFATSDAHFPSATSLTDALSNPTTTQIGSNNLGWDATNSVWRRLQVDAASGTLKVDGSGSTQPVSGTITANAGTGNYATNITQVAGNAVATGAAGILKVALTDGSGNPISSAAGALNVSGGGGGGSGSNFGTAFPTAGTAAGAEYLSSPPTLVSGNMNPLLLDVGGNLKVNVAAQTLGTLTVGGAVSATQSGTWNIAAITGSVVLPTGAATAANQVTGNNSLATIISTLASPFQAGGSIGNTSFGATQSGAWNMRLQDGSGNAITSDARGSERPLSVQILDAGGNQDVWWGGIGGSAPSYAALAGTKNTGGNTQPLLSDANGYLIVSPTNLLATDNSAFTAGTSGGSLVQGIYQSSTTNNPATAGDSATVQIGHYRQQLISPIDTGGGDMTDTTNHAEKVNCIVGCSGGTSSNASDAVATSSTNGQTLAWLYGFNGTTWDRLKDDANKNLSINTADIGGNAVSTAASGVQKVGIVGNAGATVDAAPGSAPTNAVAVQGVAGATSIPTVTGAPAAANGGYAYQVSSTPTVTASAYASGNCLGGFNSITVAGNNAQSGLLTNFQIFSKTGVLAVATVYLFEANPSSSTCTDHSTFTLNSADLGKLIGNPVSLALAAPAGATPTMAEATFTPPRPFLAGGASSSVKTIYYALVAGGAFTPGSTTEFVTKTGVVMN